MRPLLLGARVCGSLKADAVDNVRSLDLQPRVSASHSNREHGIRGG